MRTQVGIVGAGPAGLVLSHLLHPAGIESVIVEARSRAYCEGRIRAGVLEQGSRRPAQRDGLGRTHDARRPRPSRHLPAFRRPQPSPRLCDLTGKTIMVYGQHEVVKDVIAARLAAGGHDPVRGRATSRSNASIRAQPSIRFRDADGDAQRLTLRLHCRLRRLSRRLPAERARRRRLRSTIAIYPFAWLGILGRRAAGVRRVDLLQPRARLRAVQPTLAVGAALLPAVRARRRHQRVARRPHLARAAGALAG